MASSLRDKRLTATAGGGASGGRRRRRRQVFAMSPRVPQASTHSAERSTDTPPLSSASASASAARVQRRLFSFGGSWDPLAATSPAAIRLVSRPLTSTPTRLVRPVVETARAALLASMLDVPVGAAPPTASETATATAAAAAAAVPTTEDSCSRRGCAELEAVAACVAAVLACDDDPSHQGESPAMPHVVLCTATLFTCMVLGTESRVDALGTILMIANSGHRNHTLAPLRMLCQFISGLPRASVSLDVSLRDLLTQRPRHSSAREHVRAPRAGTPRAGTPRAGTPRAGTPREGHPRVAADKWIEQAGYIIRFGVTVGLVVVSEGLNREGSGARLFEISHAVYLYLHLSMSPLYPSTSPTRAIYSYHPAPHCTPICNQHLLILRVA